MIKLILDGKAHNLKTFNLNASSGGVTMRGDSFGVILPPPIELPPEPPVPGPGFRLGEPIKWKKSGKTKIIDVFSGLACQFKTTKNPDYEGTIAVVPSAGTDHVTQTLWISRSPGGNALGQTYMLGGREYDASLVSGQEPSLRWTQGDAQSPVVCELEPETTYYLNHTNEGCNGPNCPIVRSMYNNGEK